jgi:hypothetical protein
VRAMAGAIKAGIVGGLIGVGVVTAGLALPSAALVVTLAVALVLMIGIWIDDRRGGGHRGLLAGLLAVVPMAAILPELYGAALWLPPPLALAVVAALAALLPAFTFSYLGPGPRRGRRGWSRAARRGVAGTAGIVLLLACQVAAVAWLDYPRAGPPGERPALTEAVLGAVDQARQSIAGAMERARPDAPGSGEVP